MTCTVTYSSSAICIMPDSIHIPDDADVGTESLAVPTTVSPGALDVSRQLAIDLARQRVATETATTRNQQERIDRAFQAINEFEKGHVSITPIHNLKRNTSTASHQDSSELDKIGVAARVASQHSLDAAQNGSGLAHASSEGSSTGSPSLGEPFELSSEQHAPCAIKPCMIISPALWLSNATCGLPVPHSSVTAASQQAAGQARSKLP